MTTPNIMSFHRRQDKIAVADNRSQGSVGVVDPSDRAVAVEPFDGLAPGDPVPFDNGTFKALLGRTSAPVTGDGLARIESRFGVTLGKPRSNARCAQSKGVYRGDEHITDVHYSGCEGELAGKVGKQLGEAKAQSRFLVEPEAAQVMGNHGFRIEDGILRNFRHGVGFGWDLNSPDANRFIRISKHSETELHIRMIEVDGDDVLGTYDLVSYEYTQAYLNDGVSGPTASVTSDIMERVQQHSEYADMGRARWERPEAPLHTYVRVDVPNSERVAYIAPDASHFFISEKTGDHQSWQRQNFIP